MSILALGSGVIGCTGTCEGSMLTSGAPILNAALGVLAGVVGTWGVIEQFKVQQRIVELSERSVDRANSFVALANQKYNEIDRPTFKKMQTLFERYKGKQGLENEYITAAFMLKGWTANFNLAEGRAVLGVQRVFDVSLKAKQRSLGRYASGRACYDVANFTMRAAISKADAAQHAYDAERKRKLAYDKWYWERWKDGAAFLLNMGNRAVNAITGGAAGMADGIAGIGRALGQAADGDSNMAGALANRAQMFGNLSNSGFNAFGQVMGSGYFSDNTASVAAPSKSVVGYRGSLKD